LCVLCKKTWCPSERSEAVKKRLNRKAKKENIRKESKVRIEIQYLKL